MSLLVAVAGLATAFLYAPAGVFHLMLAGIAIPLGCIWCGAEIGTFFAAPAEGRIGTRVFIGGLIVACGWIGLVALLAIAIALAHAA